MLAVNVFDSGPLRRWMLMARKMQATSDMVTARWLQYYSQKLRLRLNTLDGLYYTACAGMLRHLLVNRQFYSAARPGAPASMPNILKQYCLHCYTTAGRRMLAPVAKYTSAAVLHAEHASAATCIRTLHAILQEITYLYIPI